jgi:arabinan endo-1,5-alpha-L-arabinosidase
VWKRSVPGRRDYVMYFSASRRGASDCIGMAVAASPLGPFHPRPRPLRCPDPGATLIDPAHFETRSGLHYLLYKRHRYRPREFGIWAVRVRADGGGMPGARSFRVVDGGRRQIEAPSVVTRKGRTYLFASRRSYDTCAYRTVVYVGATLRHPFRPLGSLGLRRPNGRLFCGPGGAEVRNVGGNFLMVFHAFEKNPVRAPGQAARFAWGGPLRWTSTGRPYPAPARARPVPRFVAVPVDGRADVPSEEPKATVSSSTYSGSSRWLP